VSLPSPPPLAPRDVAGIRLLLLDVDGVLTDGRLYFGEQGFFAKSFHVRDGLGIALLKRAGVATGIVTGRADAFVARRAKELGMEHVLLDVADKAAAIEALVEGGATREAIAYVGDDVNDIPAFERVAVSIAVADAHPDALASAQYRTLLPGGQGAVREVADAILAAREGRSTGRGG
jgi:3-deoxy-D-manno-octulosonate 8-phosphate phosphatase (KDO 8-P phosphatase)